MKNEGIPEDADELLRAHWILFDKDYTQTTDFSEMKEEIDDYLTAQNNNNIENLEIDGELIAKKIREYLISLEQISIYWRKVKAPRFVSTENANLHTAFLSFDRLHREANFIPILIAAVSAWGENEKTAKFVRFIEIVCFRQALQRAQSNSGRTRKWSIAKQIYCGNLTVDQAINETFWALCPWWDRHEVRDMHPESAPSVRDSETASYAFSDLEAYDHFYRYMRYFFWEYGKWLPTCKEWPETREDISVLTNDQWYKTFHKLEIEHIFPRNPVDADQKDVKIRIKAMSQYLNHWGNLTLLTKHDNASLKNSVFRDKLTAALEHNANLVFNKILRNKDYRGNLLNHAWSPNNCRQRAARLEDFADHRWGKRAMKEFKISEPPE